MHEPGGQPTKPEPTSNLDSRTKAGPPLATKAAGVSAPTPGTPATVGHAASCKATVCNDQRCVQVRAERDQLRQALTMLEATCHEALSPTAA